MPEQSTDVSRLLAATINRLRLIQVDFADQPQEVRQTYIHDEVQQAVSRLASNERSAFAKELKERFPAWDGKVDITSPAPASTKGALDEALALIARLAPTLTAEQKQTAITRLKEAGLAEQAGSAPEWPAAPLKALKTKLQLTDRDNIDPARLLELATELISFASSLDQLVWATWKQVAPKSDLKRPTPLQRSFSRFASGSLEATRPQVSADVEKVRQLTASIISAIAQASNLFAQKHSSKFAVANIEAYADKMPGMMVSKEIKCWRQFKELAPAIDAQAIEIEIQNAIAEYTEALIKGRSQA